MSFILDALRKSELERQRQSGPSVAEFPVARTERRMPVALIAIGGLLALNLAVLLFFLLRGEKDAAPTAAIAAPAATTPPANLPAPAPAAPAAAGSAAIAAPPAGLQAAAGAEGAVIYAPSDLDAGAATLAPDAPDPTLLPDAAPAYRPGPSPGAAPEDAAAVAADTGLPPLSVDLHVFADDPARRAVFINGRRYTQGATIAEGPTVEQITPEGAVLSYRGRRFLLPRL